MAIERVKPGTEAVIEETAVWVSEQSFERVLDVGGCEKPLRAATHVVDIMPYEMRRVDEGRGPLPERFEKRTWLERDCNHTTWPYRRGYFDFVWCCQVLEDLRDPIAVCKEMMRVGKAGFISTVHRSYESTAVQADGVVGYHHHRWLIELIESKLCFTWKSPILHVNPSMRPAYALDWLLHFKWSSYFLVEERFIGGDTGQRLELTGYLTRWQGERFQ